MIRAEVHVVRERVDILKNLLHKIRNNDDMRNDEEWRDIFYALRDQLRIDTLIPKVTWHTVDEVTELYDEPRRVLIISDGITHLGYITSLRPDLRRASEVVFCDSVVPFSDHSPVFGATYYEPDYWAFAPELEHFPALIPRVG